MGSFSIWHMLFLVILGLTTIPAFLPLLIKPSGGNRFGTAAQPRTLPSAVAICLQKYVDGNGRAKRSEYWWFYFAGVLASMVLVAFDEMSGSPGVITLLSWGYVLPTVAAGVRRLHDINRSGWWLLLGLTGIGIVTLIVLLAWPSQKDEAAEVF
jgi:uncharacterized membrane protein YhaH (DUF805 family)